MIQNIGRYRSDMSQYRVKIEGVEPILRPDTMKYCYFTVRSILCQNRVDMADTDSYSRVQKKKKKSYETQLLDKG